MKVDPKIEQYYQCQKDICIKEKQQETKMMDKMLKNLNNPKERCNMLLKKLQSKFDIRFIRDQRLLAIKTLGRNYIGKADMKKMKGVLDEKLLEDTDFHKLLSCKKLYTLAKQKRDKCIEKGCGKNPLYRGGTRKRRKTVRNG